MCGDGWTAIAQICLSWTTLSPTHGLLRKAAEVTGHAPLFQFQGEPNTSLTDELDARWTLCRPVHPIPTSTELARTLIVVEFPGIADDLRVGDVPQTQMWHGTLMRLGLLSRTGRYFPAAASDSLVGFPLPVRKVAPPSGGAVEIGTIDRAWLVGDYVRAEGSGLHDAVPAIGRLHVVKLLLSDTHLVLDNHGDRYDRWRLKGILVSAEIEPEWTDGILTVTDQSCQTGASRGSEDAAEGLR